MTLRTIVAVGMILFGVVIVGIGWTLYQDEQQAIENAVEVEATVIDSHVRVDTDSFEDRDGTPQDSYFPVVEYRYTYEGETYTSNNVFPGQANRSTSESRARDIVQEYDQGDRITAHVDPGNPERAFLIEEEFDLFHLGFIGGGAVTALVGIAALLWDVRSS